MNGDFCLVDAPTSTFTPITPAESGLRILR